MEHPPLEQFLDHPDDGALLAHLRVCSPCRVSLRLYKNVKSTFGEVADGSPSPRQATEELGAEARYVDLGLLSQGGMGEIRRVYDRHLDRVLVRKAARLDRPTELSRFLAEARATARLQHPGIVPVHDLDRLPDGRPFYTMEEVHGRTLSAVIAEVHGAVTAGSWVSTADGWGLRRLVDVVRATADAVAFAHSRDVLHRDIKPDNIMVGAFGSVRLVDWGLARITADRVPVLPELPPTTDPRHTQAGQVAGTPSFMAPEQAIDGLRAVGARADVYALGAVLYQVLGGVVPFAGEPDVLAALRRGPPPPLDPPATVSEELLAVCTRAMDRDPQARHPSARALASDLTAWLENARGRDRAGIALAAAASLQVDAAALRKRAVAQAEGAAQQLAALETHAPIGDRERCWALADDASALQRRAAAADAEAGEAIRTALVHAPDLLEARAALTRFYQERLVAAEAREQFEAAAGWEALLRAHDPEAARSWLEGPGRVDLVTDPAGAVVVAYPWMPHGRRLELGPARPLGTTPLRDVALPVGSHLLQAEAPGHAPVRVPVRIDRGAHWRGRRPGDADSTPIPLPPIGSLGPDDVYVPGGWFLSGPRAGEVGSGLREVWVDGFVIGRFPVSNEVWLAWLNQLVSEGRRDEALACVPRERLADRFSDGPPLMPLSADGRFTLGADGDGDGWEPDVPVCMLKVSEVEAYARDLAVRTGLPWRLPAELEWEKAARGVDGRIYPFGPHGDPAWAHTLHSRPGKTLPANIHTCPTDVSPYGVRGLAGGIADWTRDPMTAERPARTADGRAVIRARAPSEGLCATRGGCWNWHYTHGRSDLRSGHRPNARTAEIGVRLAYSWPPP